MTPRSTTLWLCLVSFESVKHIGGFSADPVFDTLGAAVDWLADGEDEGRTVGVMEVEFDERGLMRGHDATDRAAQALCGRLRAQDDPDEGIPSDERPWVHPLATAAGFAWTPTDYELEDIAADAAFDMAKEDA